MLASQRFNREFGQKFRFGFGMSVFTFVGFYNAECKSSFLLRFISVTQGYSLEHMACLNDPLKCIVAKIKTHHKAKYSSQNQIYVLPKLSNKKRSLEEQICWVPLKEIVCLICNMINILKIYKSPCIENKGYNLSLYKLMFCLSFYQ